MIQSTLEDYLNLISLTIIKNYATIVAITSALRPKWARIENCQCWSANGAAGLVWDLKNWFRIIIVECICSKYRKNHRAKVPWNIIIIASWLIVLWGDAIITLNRNNIN